MKSDKPSQLSAYKPMKMAPTLRVDDTDLPAIKKWTVGQTYEVTVKIKMISQRQGSEYEEDDSQPKKHSAVFRIESITSDDNDDTKKPDRPIVGGFKKRALNS